MLFIGWVVLLNPRNHHGKFLMLRMELQGLSFKILPAMQKTPVQFLGQEDPLEKG